MKILLTILVSCALLGECFAGGLVNPSLSGINTGGTSGGGATLTQVSNISTSIVTGYSPNPSNSAGMFYPVAKQQRFIATRSGFNGSTSSANSWIMSRTAHIAKDNITNSLSLVLWNCIFEDAGIGVATFTASVEYPSNTLYQVKFNGFTTNITASGGFAFGTATNIPLIPKGAMFWVRQFYTNATQNILYSQEGNTYTGGLLIDSAVFGTLGGIDYTMAAWPGTFTAAGLVQFPNAIIGYTALPSVLGIGDSRTFGIGDSTTDPELSVGSSRYFDPMYGFDNCGESGETLSGFTANSANRLFLTNFASAVWFYLGINSLSTSSYSQYTNAVSLFSTLPVIAGTIEPYTTSSDNWTTLAGQITVYGVQDTNRTYINTLLRNHQMPGVQRIIDLAATSESGTNSGLWSVNGVANSTTGDGLHPALTMRVAQAAAIVDPLAANVLSLPVGGGFVTGPVISSSSISATNFNGNGGGLTNINPSFTSIPQNAGHQFDLEGNYFGEPGYFFTAGTISSGSSVLTVVSTNGFIVGGGIWISNALGSAFPNSNLVCQIMAIPNATTIILTNENSMGTTFYGICSNTVTLSPVAPDNSAQWNNCVSNCMASGTNGTMYVHGLVMVDSPAVGLGNAILTFPLNTNAQGVPTSITITGDGRGGCSNGTYNGTCVLAFMVNGTGANPSVIGSGLNNTNQNLFTTNLNNINVSLQNFSIYTACSNGVSGINLLNAQSATIGPHLADFKVIPASNGAVPPVGTESNTFGVWMPGFNNNVSVSIENDVSIGYFGDGVRASELCQFRQPFIEGCFNGIHWYRAAHPSFGTASIQEFIGSAMYGDPTVTFCPINMVVDIEYSSSGPFNGSTAFTDASLKMTGNFSQNVTLAGVGVAGFLGCSVGTNMNCYYNTGPNASGTTTNGIYVNPYTRANGVFSSQSFLMLNTAFILDRDLPGDLFSTFNLFANMMVNSAGNQVSFVPTQPSWAVEMTHGTGSGTNFTIYACPATNGTVSIASALLTLNPFNQGAVLVVGGNGQINATTNISSTFTVGLLNGNGGGLTNLPPSAILNTVSNSIIISGQLYTNNTGAPLTVSANVNITTVTGVGTTGIALYSLGAFGFTNTVSITTTALSIAMPQTPGLCWGRIPTNAIYYFTNISTVGTATLSGGQQFN